MGSLSDAAKSVLEPFAGPMIAGMCLRSAASAAGKDVDSLSATDIAAFRSCAQGILHPLAPSDAIDRLLSDIERRAL